MKKFKKGFLCPNCLSALPTAELLSNHYQICPVTRFSRVDRQSQQAERKKNNTATQKPRRTLKVSNLLKLWTPRRISMVNTTVQYSSSVLGLDGGSFDLAGALVTDSTKHEHNFDVYTTDKKKHSFRADSLEEKQSWMNDFKAAMDAAKQSAMRDVEWFFNYKRRDDVSMHYFMGGEERFRRVVRLIIMFPKTQKPLKRTNTRRFARRVTVRDLNSLKLPEIEAKGGDKSNAAAADKSGAKEQHGPSAAGSDDPPPLPTAASAAAAAPSAATDGGGDDDDRNGAAARISLSILDDVPNVTAVSSPVSSPCTTSPEEMADFPAYELSPQKPVSPDTPAAEVQARGEFCQQLRVLTRGKASFVMTMLQELHLEQYVHSVWDMTGCGVSPFGEEYMIDRGAHESDNKLVYLDHWARNYKARDAIFVEDVNKTDGESYDAWERDNPSLPYNLDIIRLPYESSGIDETLCNDLKRRVLASKKDQRKLLIVMDFDCTITATHFYKTLFWPSSRYARRLKEWMVKEKLEEA